MQTLSAILLHFNRRFGIRTSGVQFFFWLLLVICGIPQLRTQYREWQKNVNDNHVAYAFVSYTMYFVMSTVILILNCFADKEPEYVRCPRAEVFFLTQIT